MEDQGIRKQVDGVDAATVEAGIRAASPMPRQARDIVNIGRSHTYYVNERGERANLVALHRMNLHYLRKRLLDEAGDIFKLGDMDDEKSKTLTSLMQDYCTAIRDREYMREWAQRDWARNPFHLKAERPLERDLLEALKARGISPAEMINLGDKGSEPVLPCGPWDLVSASQTHRQRYALAITGGIILVVPMIIMVVVKNTNVSLGVVSGFTIAFAVGLSYFSPTRLPIELLSATAAYAAVLVVFVGGTAGQGQS